MEIPSVGYAWKNLENKVDTLVKDLVESENLPGVTVAVTKNGRLILSKGYGWANTTTKKAMEPFMRSRIGSVGKAAVTGPSAWRLMKEKGIDPVQTKLYGPDGFYENRFAADIAAGPGPVKSWYDQITIQHLLDHRAGFVRSGDQPGAADLFNTNIDSLSYEQIHQFMLRKHKLKFEPGSEYSYSNHGFGSLTLIIEKLSGESYPDYTRKRYLRSLGLHHYIVAENTLPEARDAWSHIYNDQGKPVPIGFKDAGLGLAAGGFRASAQDLTYLMSQLEERYSSDEIDAMGWGKSSRGKFSHNGRKEGGTAQVVMFSEGYRSVSGLDLSRVHVALVTNISMSDTGKLDSLASDIALEVPGSGLPSNFAITQILRHDTDLGGSFDEISMDGSVAALSNSDNNLQLIPFTVQNLPDRKGIIGRGEVVQAGKVSQVNIIHPNPRNSDAVTAFRDSEGNLKLIAWAITSGGQVTRRGEATAGAVKDVALTRFPDDKGVITLTKGNQGEFKLIAWELTSSLGIVRRGDIDAGAVKEIAVTTTAADFDCVVSATTDNDNKLKLIAWQFDSATKRFTRRGDAEAGEIRGQLNIVRTPIANQNIIVTAFQNQSGNLMLITWQVSAAGQITRRASRMEGDASLIELTTTPAGQVMASVKDGDDVLRIIAYEVESNGQIQRVGTEIAGKVDRIASSGIRRNQHVFLFTNVRDGDKKLRTITWEID